MWFSFFFFGLESAVDAKDLRLNDEEITREIR
jgi:hypothetical protein